MQLTDNLAWPAAARTHAWSLLSCRDRPQRPFKCLDAQYRRELLRVYLTNVEGIARRFVDEKRGQLQRLIDDARGGGFKQFWRRLDATRQRKLSSDSAAAVFKVGAVCAGCWAGLAAREPACWPDPVHATQTGCAHALVHCLLYRLHANRTVLPLHCTASVLLQGVVKRFFNEKEVTSTLVMDALYCGAKLLEEAGRRWVQDGGASAAAAQAAAAAAAAAASSSGDAAAVAAAAAMPAEPCGVLIDARRGIFFFAGDAVRCVCCTHGASAAPQPVCLQPP